jgi:hypothetical protein
MARTSFLDIPEGFDFAYKKALNSSDRFVFPSVRLKPLFQSRRRKKGVSQKSLMPLCSQLWAEFSQGEKDAWTSAGQVMNISGFRLFLQDQTLRVQNDLTGVSTPSNIYQTKVGRCTVSAPATKLLLTQLHPLNYWVSRVIRGSKGMREPVLITEDFALPLSIKISYKTNLTSISEDYKARFYAIVYSLYQGRTIENVVEIPFTLSSGWVASEASLNSVIGLAKSYALFIELTNVRGDLFIDNIEANHSGFNWARDPYCRDIDQAFTKAFYQVPKHWVAVDIEQGDFFGSLYYNAI